MQSVLCTLLSSLTTPWSLGFSKNMVFAPYPTTVFRSLSLGPNWICFSSDLPISVDDPVTQVAQANKPGVFLSSVLLAKGQVCFSEQSQLDFFLGLWILSGWHKVRKLVGVDSSGPDSLKSLPISPCTWISRNCLCLCSSTPFLHLSYLSWAQWISFELSMFNICVLFSIKQQP